MKIVIFDMDGTLIDSQQDITLSVNHVREQHYGLEPLTNDYVVDAINMYKRNLAKLFYGTDEYHEKDRELFEAHYHDQCIQNVRLYDGIRDMLTMLEEMSVKMSVATNAPGKFAMKMLTHLGVSDHFEHIIGADMVPNPKPDKDMLSKILDDLGYSHRNDKGWMVGDNVKDMEAAKNAGIKSIFVTWGFSDIGEGDHVIHDPSLLYDVIA